MSTNDKTTDPVPTREQVVEPITGSKPDLSAAPYELDAEAISWVRSTVDSMTEDERIGQLFTNLNNRFDDDFVNNIVDTYHPGGMRYNHTDSASVQAHIRHAQGRSKIPLLVASNIEAGGNGACTDGTHVATPLQTASTPDTDAARQMGLVGARESRALGCNWAFTPIVDIHHNWRNTVIATRAFGNDHKTVITSDKRSGASARGQTRRTQRVHRHVQRQRLVRLLGRPTLTRHE